MKKAIKFLAGPLSAGTCAGVSTYVLSDSSSAWWACVVMTSTAYFIGYTDRGTRR